MTVRCHDRISESDALKMRIIKRYNKKIDFSINLIGQTLQDRSKLEDLGSSAGISESRLEATSLADVDLLSRARSFASSGLDAPPNPALGSPRS